MKIYSNAIVFASLMTIFIFLWFTPLGSADEASNSDEQVKWDRAHLQAMSFRLNTLETLVREQNTQIQKLQHDLKNPTTFREVLTKELDAAMSANRMHMVKMFDNYMNVQTNRERDYRESFMDGLSGAVRKQITEQLKETIDSDVKRFVMPRVMSIMENVIQQLQVQTSKKLDSMDVVLKDTIKKLVTSKVRWVLLMLC